MPVYEYRCRECDRLFEVRREVGTADAPVQCPGGHSNTARLLPTFGTTRHGGSAPERPKAPCAAQCTCHRVGALAGGAHSQN